MDPNIPSTRPIINSSLDSIRASHPLWSRGRRLHLLPPLLLRRRKSATSPPPAGHRLRRPSILTGALCRDGGDCAVFSNEGYSRRLFIRDLRLIETSGAARAGVLDAKQPVQPSEVDQLVKKVNDMATKALLVEYTQSLAQEMKTDLASPHLPAFALPSIIASSSIGFFMAGYWLGFEEIAEKRTR